MPRFVERYRRRLAQALRRHSCSEERTIDSRMNDRHRLFEILRREGVHSPHVLAAMELIPREQFVPPALAERAYENRALPIGSGQTISQPSIVARMTTSLKVDRRCRVLEVGTGSGYQTAILAALAREVYTIERHEELSRQAADRLAKLGWRNVHYLVGDGTIGWPGESPFDRILITASGPRVPKNLLEQLAEGGRLVAPIGNDDEESQRLVVYAKQDGHFTCQDLGGCRFVPLVGEQGWPEDFSENA